MIERAKDLLGKGATVKSVAAELGYNDGPAFSKAFRASTQQWPSQIAGRARIQLRKPAGLAK
jgi:AraC-like DNA-binding protein